MLASNGTLYGTTQDGGTSNGGVLYYISSAFGINTPYNFSGDGTNPNAGLVEGNDGNLYGVSYTFPEIYSWNLSGGTYHALASLGEGEFIATLMQDTNGIFYGVSEIYGTHSDGYVFSFSNGLSPFVAFVKPRGAVGGSAEILGQGLTGTTSVTFNGISASFTVVSDTYMTATVPTGATTGPVVVTTPTGPLTSNKSFTITE